MQLPVLPVKHWVNKRFFYNQRFEKLIWTLYYAPDRQQSSVPISARATAWLAEFRQKGVVIIPGLFPELADYLAEGHFAYLEGRQRTPAPWFARTLDMGARGTANGITYAAVSFRDPILEQVLFDADLCGVVYNYYGRQPYYRELPRLVLNVPGPDSRPESEITTKFHLDYYRQISFMLLVNDVSEDDTHLQYAVGSHLAPAKPWNRFSYPDEKVEAEYPIVKCCGPKGTLIIFEPGSGYHRAHFVKNSVRKTLQTVITTGHYLTTDEKVDSASDWPALSRYPEHVRRMMDKMILP